MKKLRLMMAVLLSAVGFTAAAAELASYAPKDTKLIVFVNAKQVARSRIFKTMMQQYPDLKAEINKFGAEAQKEMGVPLPQLLNAEYCFFCDFEKKDQELDVIFRMDDPIFEKIIEQSKKRGNATLSSVDGKRMLKTKDADGDGFSIYIELSPNLISVSEYRTTPLTPGFNKLAAEIDTDALLSAAFDFSAVKDDNFKQDIFWQLKQLSANLRETKDGLHCELVAEYGSAEATQKAYFMWNETVQSAINTPPQEAFIPEINQWLSRLKLQQSKNKVIFSITVTDKEIFNFINTVMTDKNDKKNK